MATRQYAALFFSSSSFSLNSLFVILLLSKREKEEMKDAADTRIASSDHSDGTVHERVAAAPAAEIAAFVVFVSVTGNDEKENSMSIAHWLMAALRCVSVMLTV